MDFNVSSYEAFIMVLVAASLKKKKRKTPFHGIKEKYPQWFEIAAKILYICLKLNFHHII